MTNKESFSWTWTALVTPFDENDNIDFIAFDKLIERQIEWKIDWILFLWTTWENPTITDEEGFDIVSRWIEKIDWRCKVMVNVWTNCTKKTIKFINHISKIKFIDALLVVNPYYNKPTQMWLYSHFKTIADSTDLPIFIYNIKSRTWVNLETDTLLRLIKDCKNIIWVKEASCDINQIKDVINRTHEDFIVLSWDDWITFDLIKNGWDWVISVASNFLPYDVSDFVKYWLKWDFDMAEKLNNKLLEFFEWQFIQTNPIPIKTALAYIWLIKEQFRLPMCQMDPEFKNKWLDIVRKYI
jgi:4-hydroxy-tetrahydrodipicolinate synthase